MSENLRESMLIDDFQRTGVAHIGNRWQFFSDRVMGGVSQGYADVSTIDGRQAMCLRGEVSLENNGGFIQVALDLGAEGKDFDAGGFTGVALTCRGDGGRYAVNLRSADIVRPWQSYRCSFTAESNWQTHYLPFSDFEANRIDVALQTQRLRRIGIISIGEAGAAEVCISRLAFYSAEC